MPVSANTILAMFAIGTGLAFLLSDWRTATTRALAGFYLLLGCTVFVNASFIGVTNIAELPWWSKASGSCLALTVAVGAEWVWRVRQTITDSTALVVFGNRLLRVAQCISLIYAIAAIAFGEQHIAMMLRRSNSNDLLGDQLFLVFTGLFLVASIIITVIEFMTLLREPDPAEKARFVANVVGVVFLCTGFVQGPDQSPPFIAAGLIIAIIGTFRYQTMQGQRGALMSRFLAPQVAEMIRSQGMQRSLGDAKQEMSVVFCDLRGFTSWSAQNEASRVLDLLRRYYELVGEVAARHEATIKDYAGDGVMLLVGAPLAREDHAITAINMAADIRDVVGQMLIAQQGSDMKIGVGVATGTLQIGVVGVNRLEYAAVGSATNLAARLCDNAKAGEILLSVETFNALKDNSQTGECTQNQPLQLKGWDAPVPVYLLNR